MTPEQAVAGAQRAMAIIEGTLLYKQQLITMVLRSDELEPKYKQAYEMLATMVANFIEPVRAELDFADIMWTRWLGGSSKYDRIGPIVIPTPVSFTAEISAAGKALNDYSYVDRSLEGLADPIRFKEIHNALTSDLCICSCSGFWYDEQLREWWSDLQDYQRDDYRKFWNTWRRAIAGGLRQVHIGRACFPDAAGFFWRAEGHGLQTTTSRNEEDFDQAYLYYQDQPQKPMICYDGCYVLDTSQLSGGDSALLETSPYDIDDTDPD